MLLPLIPITCAKFSFSHQRSCCYGKEIFDTVPVVVPAKLFEGGGDKEWEQKRRWNLILMAVRAPPTFLPLKQTHEQTHTHKQQTNATFPLHIS
jgi:hypothetical protein